jgi:hypothetical protein
MILTVPPWAWSRASGLACPDLLFIGCSYRVNHRLLGGGHGRRPGVGAGLRAPGGVGLAPGPGNPRPPGGEVGGLEGVGPRGGFGPSQPALGGFPREGDRPPFPGPPERGFSFLAASPLGGGVGWRRGALEEAVLAAARARRDRLGGSPGGTRLEGQRGELCHRGASTTRSGGLRRRGPRGAPPGALREKPHRGASAIPPLP